MQINARTSVILSVLLALLASCCLPREAAAQKPQKPLKLTWKLKPRQVLRFRKHTVTRTGAKNDDRGMVIDETSDLRWVVKSVDKSGLAVVEQTVVRTQKSAEGLTEFSWDSAEPTPLDRRAEAMVKNSRDLVGKRVLLSIDRFGRLKKTKVLAGSEGLTGNLMVLSGFELPEDGIVPEQKWEQVSERSTVGGLTRATTTFRFEGSGMEKGRRIARFAVTEDRTCEPIPGTRFTMKFTARESEGTLRFDVSRGRLLSLHSMVDLLVETEMQGRKTGRNTRTTSRLTLLEGADARALEKLERKLARQAKAAGR